MPCVNMLLKLMEYLYQIASIPYIPGESKEFYAGYSRVKGFTIRKSKRVKNTKGEVVRYNFVCSRDGFRHKKWLEKFDRKREHKLITRCGRLAEMRIKRNTANERWCVERFLNDHNQTLLAERFVRYLLAHQSMSDVEIAQMNMLRQVKISISKIYQIVCNAGSFSELLEMMKRCFGDIRISTNGFLNNFLNCMGSKALKAVITDEDPTMRLVIMQVFLEARHRLCALHLLRNVMANVAEFEMQWEAMIDECGVRKVEWVRDLYRKKLSWSIAYIRGKFFANIRTTSQCESLHAKLGNFMESRYGIFCEFLKMVVRYYIVDRKEGEHGCCYVIQKYRQPKETWQVVHMPSKASFRCSYR
ncbi:hypothetical protein Ahy_B05g075755 [Arachis hypogaea]|uniref:FAR1 domain-containing protein n=1 Tax=Arachis hypogaea TaxID=3818 RepID=A0A444Z1X3_ARAHY|nr:hypothetical protein Ahy_B05g075755 [Arachis hypogaea]